MGQQHDYQYKHFKATVPERQISVGAGNQLRWRYYDFGPRAIPPLLCLGGVAATADAFHKQVLALAAKGFRVIAADPPPVWSHQQWVKAVDQFLDALRVHQVHLYGTSLGGFLFQLYAYHRPRRVLSLVLSNAFFDTHFFNVAFGSWSSMFSYAPDFVLKRVVLSGLRDGPHEPLIADSIDFVVSRLDALARSDLASRLTLNTLPVVLPPLQQLPEQSITLMDCNDFAAVAWQLRDALYTRYPNATRAFLKSGGDFPFLSRADEVNLHLFLHLRRVDAEREPGHSDTLAPAPSKPPPAAAATAAAAPAGSADSAASTSPSVEATALGLDPSLAPGSFASVASAFSSPIPSTSTSSPLTSHAVPSSSTPSSSLLTTPGPLQDQASLLAPANPLDPLSPPLADSDPLGLAWQGSPLQPPPPLVPAPEAGISSSLTGGEKPAATAAAASASVAAATALTAAAAMLTVPPVYDVAGSGDTSALLTVGLDMMVGSDASRYLSGTAAEIGAGAGAGGAGAEVGEAVRAVSVSSSDVTAGEEDGEEVTSTAAQALEGAEGEVLSREGTTGGPLGGCAEEGSARGGGEAEGEGEEGNESEEEDSEAADFRSQASNWLRFVEPEHYGGEEAEVEEEGRRRGGAEGLEGGEGDDGDGVEDVSGGVERLAVGDSPLG
ncbi:hypothetical protein CLOP_g17274 [Closterium sp. NIES-67]|nr:hypothetical protein CLOP_g17274 [Closterium sp. NIES-67]